jgi:hypothetical protein
MNDGLMIETSFDSNEINDLFLVNSTKIIKKLF